ncbi:MAG: DUF4124 domain-containing protein [Gammaproteobacteria bacterium]|jgi:hypothetical protein|nr:DUF4124 domain-containing protein [Gammaproteobacteria bacterium]
MKKLSIALISLLLAAPLYAQHIYRVVDENGNVIYTDQKPSDDAEPMELPELNVLDGDAGVPPELEGDASQEPRQALNFRIQEPADGETVEMTGRSLQVVMGIDIEIPPTAEIVLVFDGQELDPVRSLRTGIEVPSTGEHRLFARLQTPSGRVLGTTDPVTFTTTTPGID